MAFVKNSISSLIHPVIKTNMEQFQGSSQTNDGIPRPWRYPLSQGFQTQIVLQKARWAT